MIPQDTKCPTCGAHIDPNDKRFATIISVAFSERQRKILEFLGRRFGVRVPTSSLLDFVYRDDPNGGPNTANKSVNVSIHVLRERLRPFGLTIKGYGGGRGGGGEVVLRKITE